MIIFAIYHESHGFIGLYASPESSKSFSREFVDCVICHGEEGSCDLLAHVAGDRCFNTIMGFMGWKRQSDLDCFDQTFSCYAFKLEST